MITYRDPTVAALARLVHFACVEVDGEWALRHEPEAHEKALAVALKNLPEADRRLILEGFDRSPRSEPCRTIGASPHDSDSGTICVTHKRRWRECPRTDPRQIDGVLWTDEELLERLDESIQGGYRTVEVPPLVLRDVLARAARVPR